MLHTVLTEITETERTINERLQGGLLFSFVISIINLSEPRFSATLCCQNLQKFTKRCKTGTAEED